MKKMAASSRILATAALMLSGVQVSQADTFRFAFQASDFLTALEGVESPGNFANSGYYEFWGQPVLGNFSNFALTSPRQAPNDAWLTDATATDPFRPQDGSGTYWRESAPYAHFFIDDTAGMNATVVSVANAIRNLTYTVDTIFCNGCWARPHQVTQLQNGSGTPATFDGWYQVQMDTSVPLAGQVPVTWHWQATSFVVYPLDPTIVQKIGFQTFNLVAAPVPEPSSLALAGLATLALCAFGRRQRRHCKG